MANLLRDLSQIRRRVKRSSVDQLLIRFVDLSWSIASTRPGFLPGLLFGASITAWPAELVHPRFARDFDGSSFNSNLR